MNTLKREQSTTVSREQIQHLLAPGPTEHVKYVEVEVVEERIREVRQPIIQEVEVPVKVPIEKVVEHIEEFLQIEEIIKYVTVPVYEDKIIEVEVPMVIEKPVDVPVYQKKIEVKYVEHIREVEVLEYIDKNINIEVKYDVPVLKDREEPVMVAQTLMPILNTSSTDIRSVTCKSYELNVIHVDVPIPKPVSVVIQGTLKTNHSVVSVPAPQWNYLVKRLNSELLIRNPDLECLLPYAQTVSGYIPMLKSHEQFNIVVPKVPISSIPLPPRAPVILTSGTEIIYTLVSSTASVRELTQKRRAEAYKEAEMESKRILDMFEIQRKTHVARPPTVMGPSSSYSGPYNNGNNTVVFNTSGYTTSAASINGSMSHVAHKTVPVNYPLSYSSTNVFPHWAPSNTVANNSVNTYTNMPVESTANSFYKPISTGFNYQRYPNQYNSHPYNNIVRIGTNTENGSPIGINTSTSHIPLYDGHNAETNRIGNENKMVDQMHYSINQDIVNDRRTTPGVITQISAAEFPGNLTEAGLNADIETLESIEQ